MATFTDIHPFPPKFCSARTTCAPCEIRGSKHREHTTHMCRPHRVRTSTRAPTTRTAPHTQRCSPHDHLQLSRAAVINSYSLSAQLGVALRHQLTPRVGMVPTNLKYTTGGLDRLPQRDLQRVVRSGLRLRDPDHLGRGALIVREYLGS